MLLKRVLTASVLVPLLLAAVFYGKGWPFFLVVGAAALLCAAEYSRMFFRSARDRWSAAAAALACYACGALLPAGAALPACLLCASAAAFHFLVHGQDCAERTRLAAMASLGTVYLGGFLSAFPRVISLPRGEHWVVAGLVAVAAGDTLAYFTGKALGRRQLSPRISPNKTVEGAIGGLAGSVVLTTAYVVAFLPDVPAWYAVASAATLGAVGQMGDLFESMLKRAAGVKDSGTLLPGHGGMLDRADGMLAAGPALYLLAALSPLAGAAG